MAENTRIEWAHHTWNPWRGCQHATLPDGSAHPGCLNCYAETMSARNPATLGIWGPQGNRVMAVDKTFDAPLVWNRKARERGERARVFVDSLSDFFEDWQGPILDHKGGRLYNVDANPIRVASESDEPFNREAGDWLLTMDDLRRRAFDIIDQCDWLDLLILTKRPQNARQMWPKKNVPRQTSPTSVRYEWTERARRDNVWLLYSASEQRSLEAGWDSLVGAAPLCAAWGLSLEPLVGPIDLHTVWRNGPLPSWVIVGGESGPGARPMHPQWARDIRDQCAAASVAFFFKQWGEWIEDDFCLVDDRGRDPWPRIFLTPSGQQWQSVQINSVQMRRVGKAKAGRLLDGEIHDAFPSQELLEAVR